MIKTRKSINQNGERCTTAKKWKMPGAKKALKVMKLHSTFVKIRNNPD